MSPLLPGTILKQRYQVIKVLYWEKKETAYEVWDTKVSDKRWILLEISPPRSTLEELNRKREQFYEHLELLTQLQHPNLTKIIDYFRENQKEYVVVEEIQGIPLQRFLGVVQKLNEQKVLEIGIILCNIFIYLYDRPQPLTFGDINEKTLWMTFDGDIKYTGYHLRNFFGEDEDDEEDDDAPPFSLIPPTRIEEGGVESSIRQISRLLFLLLGGRGNDTDRISVSSSFRNLLRRTLSPGQKSYSSLHRYKEELNRILHPEQNENIEEEIERARKKRYAEIPDVNILKKLPKILLNKFLSQRKPLIAFEVFSLVFLFSVLLIFNSLSADQYESPSGTPLIYVSSGENLLTFREDTLELIDQRKLGSGIKGLYTFSQGSKKYLFVCDSPGENLLMVDPANNGIKKKIPVDLDPIRITGNTSLSRLFVLHGSTGNVTVMDSGNFKMLGIIGTGINPTDFVYYPPHDRMLVVNKNSENLVELDTDKKNITLSYPFLDKPGRMLLSPDERYLYVIYANQILILDGEQNFAQVDELPNLGGLEPTSLLWDVRENHLWITFARTHNIVLYDVSRKKAKESYPVGKSPEKAVWGVRDKKIWIINRNSRDVAIFLPYGGYVEKRFALDKSPEDITVLDPLSHK